MATQNLVELPNSFYGQFNQGRPLFNASIFVGEPDTDPELVINQKQVTLVLEDGTEVPVSQPINTGPGGYISSNGSPATMFVKGNYSIKCLNSLGAQEYFFENVFNKPAPSGDDASFVDSVAEMDALNPAVGETIVTTGYTTVDDGGGNTYEIEANTGQSIDDGRFILLNNGNVAKGLFPGGVVNIVQFAAIGDGNSANKATNLTAITNAQAFSDDALVPAGVFAVELSVTPAITPPANATLYGISKTVSKIIIVTTDTTARSFFKVDGGNFIFKDIGVTVDGPVNASVQVFSPQSSNIRIQDSDFDGGNTSGNANIVNFFNFGNANSSNIFVKNCDIHNMQRVIQRDISATGEISNVEFSNNEIHDLGQGGVQFNCPGAECRNIRILGNHFREFHAGTEQIFCGGSNIDGITIQGNAFNGNANECIHIEEGGQDITIGGNTFKAASKGISLFSNNVGTTVVTEMAPKRITITDNSFFDGSLTRANVAINAPITVVGASNDIDSYEDLIIADNTFIGYDIGIYTGKTPAKITGNTIKNCNIGHQANIPWPEVFGNTFENCGIGVFGISADGGHGGMIGNNFFRDPLTIASTQDGSKISMTGFKVSLESDINLPASTVTTINVGISVGAEMFGDSKVMIFMDSPSLFQHRISETSYDGATFIDTENMRSGSGGVSFNGLVNNGGNLAIELNNTIGTDQTLNTLTMQFDGMWVSTG